jgi:hypothetical protein
VVVVLIRRRSPPYRCPAEPTSVAPGRNASPVVGYEQNVDFGNIWFSLAFSLLFLAAMVALLFLLAWLEAPRSGGDLRAAAPGRRKTRIRQPATSRAPLR